MGTPLPPNVPGVNCTSCFNPGKPFAGFTTPKFITCTWTDFQPGAAFDPDLEALLRSPHLLEQRPNPCFYGFLDGVFDWAFEWFLGSTNAFVHPVGPGGFGFEKQGEPPCSLILPNGLNDFANSFAFGGFFNIQLTF